MVLLRLLISIVLSAWKQRWAKLVIPPSLAGSADPQFETCLLAYQRQAHFRVFDAEYTGDRGPAVSQPCSNDKAYFHAKISAWSATYQASSSSPHFFKATLVSSTS